MSTFLIRNAQRNQLRDLQLAIHGLLQRQLNLSFSNNAEALEDLNKIEEGLVLVQKYIQGARRDNRIMGFSTKQRTGRNAEFESELGRVGQIRGELALLQNQLAQLEKTLPAIRKRIVDGMNHPMNVGSNILEHLDELGKKKAGYTQLMKMVSQPQKESVIEGLKQQPVAGGDLALAFATLATFIYAFMKRSKKG